MTCPRFPGVACPATPCPGSDAEAACRIVARSAAASVANCPDRGGVLPLSLQPDCDCRGKELSLCRAGQGAVPGRATMTDCLACRTARPA